MEMRYGIQIAAASLAMLGGMEAPRLPRVTPEKYPGQRMAYLRGAWRGDGVPPDPKRSKGRKCRQV